MFEIRQRMAPDLRDLRQHLTPGELARELASMVMAPVKLPFSRHGASPASETVEEEGMAAHAVAAIKEHPLDQPIEVGQRYVLQVALYSGPKDNIHEAFRRKAFHVSWFAQSVKNLFRPAEGVKIDVLVYAEDMEIEPSKIQSLVFRKEQKSSRLTFIVKPTEQGRKTIRIQYYYHQRWLAELEIDIEAREVQRPVTV
jgi:hypothetical protein